MKTLSEICFWLGYFVKVCLITLALSGCITAPGLTSSAPTQPVAGAIVAVVDSINDHYQPDLPNDLDKSGSVALPDTGQVAPAAVPIVTVYTKPRCDACDKLKADVRGYTALDFRFKADPTADAPWIYQKIIAGEGFPFLVWKDANGKEVYSHGWPGLAAWLKRYNASLKTAAATEIRTLPPSTGNASAAARYIAVSYPVRGNWWSGCDSWRHLTRGEHDGKFDAGWLKSLSSAELQSLHSDDHEGRVKWNYVVRPRQSVPVQQRQSASAAGVIPQSRRGRASRDGLHIGLACPWCGGG